MSGKDRYQSLAAIVNFSESSPIAASWCQSVRTPRSGGAAQEAANWKQKLITAST